MGDALGDVSLDTGYAEALIIYGNRTIQGVGGGVCQVSTTLFRTAFFGGYPVVERYPHAYRVSYYEYTAGGDVDPDLAGLDATVFTPVVDFRFTNDTPYWLLMETYVNVRSQEADLEVLLHLRWAHGRMGDHGPAEYRRAPRAALPGKSGPGPRRNPPGGLGSRRRRCHRFPYRFTGWRRYTSRISSAPITCPGAPCMNMARAQTYPNESE